MQPSQRINNFSSPKLVLQKHDPLKSKQCRVPVRGYYRWREWFQPNYELSTTNRQSVLDRERKRSPLVAEILSIDSSSWSAKLFTESQHWGVALRSTLGESPCRSRAWAPFYDRFHRLVELRVCRFQSGPRHNGTAYASRHEETAKKRASRREYDPNRPFGKISPRIRRRNARIRVFTPPSRGFKRRLRITTSSGGWMQVGEWSKREERRGRFEERERKGPLIYITVFLTSFTWTQ